MTPTLKRFVVELEHWYAWNNPYCKAARLAADAGLLGGYDPQLLTPEGDRCCLGFYCDQAGVPDEDTLDTSAPCGLGGAAPGELAGPFDGSRAAYVDTDMAELAMGINDTTGLSLEEKMAELKKLFAKYGTELVFTLKGEAATKLKERSEAKQMSYPKYIYEDRERIEVAPPYEPRFVSQEQLTELCNLRHLARTALAGTDRNNRHGQMVWAAREFHKKHPEVSETGAYKDLSAAMAQNDMV